MKNTVPFTLGDYPVDKLDQEQMRWLRRLADHDGVTVEDLIGEALRLFLANFNESEAKKKIIRFRRSAPNRKSKWRKKREWKF